MEKCSWIWRINIVKINILYKAIYRFNTIPINLLMAFFTGLGQIISQFVGKYKKKKKTWIAKAILRKNYGTEGINLLDFRLYYKSTVIKTVWYWHKDRNINQGTQWKAQDKSMHLWMPYLWKRKQKYSMEMTVSLTIGAGTIGQQPEKEWN